METYLGNENHTASQGIFNSQPEPQQVCYVEGGILREEASGARVTVRFVRCSTRELDPLANLPGSFKALEDLLRYCGLIEDDRASDSYNPLPPEQVKVKTRKEHQTIIELDYEMPSLRSGDQPGLDTPH